MSKTKQTKRNLIAPVSSLAELFRKAATEDPYAQLAIAAAQNLGLGNELKPDWLADPETRRNALQHARLWLERNAAEAEDSDEDAVVAEINFCRDLIPYTA